MPSWRAVAGGMPNWAGPGVVPTWMIAEMAWAAIGAAAPASSTAPRRAGRQSAAAMTAAANAIITARSPAITRPGLEKALPAVTVCTCPAAVRSVKLSHAGANAAAVVAAALWRPARRWAVLLAGAAVPMAAQAISALVQVGETHGPAQFGIPPATARQLGITISAGLTPAFWIYCGFLIALVVSCAWMLFTPQPVPVTAGDGYGWNGPRPDAPAGQEPGEAAAATPEAETPEASHTAASDHAAAGARDGDSPG